MEPVKLSGFATGRDSRMFTVNVFRLSSGHLLSDKKEEVEKLIKCGKFKKALHGRFFLSIF